MDDHHPSAEARLHAERSERRRLSLEAAELADQIAAVERHVSVVHDALTASHPDDPRFAAKADHARRSAASAEAFAIVERKVAATEDPAEAREVFEPYQEPAPADIH